MAEHQLFLDEAPVLDYPHFESKVVMGNAEGRRDVSLNMAWRRQVLKWSRDPENQQKLLEMCKEDSLFWANCFVYVFEPRPKPKILPFCMWPHQIPVWKETERWLGYRDIGWEKSRAEGASWMSVLLALHKFLFEPMSASGFVSKDENAVDTPNNPDTMFWKLDWCLGNSYRNMRPTLPDWMIPSFDRNHSEHTFVNYDNGATIAGYAATGNVATGGRKTFMVMDELAKFPRPDDKHAMNSTRAVTYSRLMVSSPWGMDGEYFNAMHSDSNMVKLKLHWTDNPTRNPGLYRVQIGRNNERRVLLDDKVFWAQMANENGVECLSGGQVDVLAEEIKDDTPNNPFGYPFMTTGPFVKHDFPRSPWYDFECKRPDATPQGIAQEYDIDYGGTSSRFFDVNILQRLQNDCIPPKCKGEIKLPDSPQSWMDLKNCKFEVIHGGRLAFWFTVDMLDLPPAGRNFIVGGDVAAGTAGSHSTNSTLYVIDRMTGIQVAAYAAPDLVPERFAEYAVALCLWFTGPEGVPATLIWEQNGPGTQFGKRVADLGYPYIYYRGSTEEMTERETGKMGFWTSGKTKRSLLGEFSRAIDRRECVVADHYLLEEAKSYMDRGGDKIEHIAAYQNTDPTSAGANHGDRVIGGALAWHLAKEYVLGGSSQTSIPVDTPANCALGRRLKAAREAALEREHVWVPPSQLRFTGKRPWRN